MYGHINFLKISKLPIWKFNSLQLLLLNCSDTPAATSNASTASNSGSTPSNTSNTGANKRGPCSDINRDDDDAGDKRPRFGSGPQ